LWVLEHYLRRFDDYVLDFLMSSSTIDNTVSSGGSGGGGGGGGGIVEFNECCIT
jgi:hypothetical protein